MTDWQPIETAPKDQRILVYIPRGPNNPGNVTIARWDNETCHSNPRPHFSSREFQRINGKQWMRANQPTHWAPLPSGPEQA